jgi:putative membrane protein
MHSNVFPRRGGARHSTRRHLALVLAVAAATALSACGDDDEAARTNPPGSERSANAANTPGGTSTGQSATPARTDGAAGGPGGATSSSGAGSTSGTSAGAASGTAAGSASAPGPMAAAPTARPNPEANAAVGTSERKFMTTAASGGMMEVEAGKLGQERGQSAAVKQFGATLMRDHEQVNAELKQLAERKGIELPTQMTKEHQAQLDKLRKAKGAEFDRMYIEQVGLEEHKKDIAAFERVIRESNDAEVRDFAQKTLPVLQKHHAQAKQLEDTMRSSSAKASSNTATGSAGGAGRGGTPGAGGSPGGSSSSSGPSN